MEVDVEGEKERGRKRRSRWGADGGGGVWCWGGWGWRLWRIQQWELVDDTGMEGSGLMEATQTGRGGEGDGLLRRDG